MLRYYVSAGALLCLVACGGGSESTETPSTDSVPVTNLAATDTVMEEVTPPEPAPLSPEQQAATNAEINLTALAAYKDFVETFKADTGAYPVTKRNFRSAVGAFEDASEALSEDETSVKLDLPEGAEMSKPGAIVYRSDGTDYKLIAQRTGDCSVIRDRKPELVDPKRDYGPGDCVAYGYWTAGAETW